MCRRRLLYADATSSEQWGSGVWDYGKYPAKVYTIDGVLIYQVESGTTNTGKIPKGGVVVQESAASSILEAISNPIIHYHGNGKVISQDGHSGDLYNYYWTSYSRGTDGRVTNDWKSDPSWHNVYLDGYIPLRVKSIYDPCPYLYRIPSNGTYNQFSMQSGWTIYSYLGGVSWDLNTLGTSWLPGLGVRNSGSSSFWDTERFAYYTQSTCVSQASGYSFEVGANKLIIHNYSVGRSYGYSVRCIEYPQSHLKQHYMKNV